MASSEDSTMAARWANVCFSLDIYTGTFSCSKSPSSECHTRFLNYSFFLSRNGESFLIWNKTTKQKTVAAD
jgi:hypothetical protein